MHWDRTPDDYALAERLLALLSPTALMACGVLINPDNHDLQEAVLDTVPPPSLRKMLDEPGIVKSLLNRMHDVALRSDEPIWSQRAWLRDVLEVARSVT